jgi:hypothetical protein
MHTTAMVARRSNRSGSLRWLLTSGAALLLLATPALALPFPVDGPVPDPDAAAGLDNFNWNPAPGTIRLQGVPDGRPVVPLADTARPESASDGDWVRVSDYCPHQAADRDLLDIRGCFTIFNDRSEVDPDHNVYKERFLVGTKPKRDTRLVRVKGRSFQRDARNVYWDPSRDRDVGEPTQITVGVSPITVTFSVSHGLVHPYAGERIFHSSWVSSDGYGQARVTQESGGVSEWRVPTGAMMFQEGNWEVWYYPGKRR